MRARRPALRAGPREIAFRIAVALQAVQEPEPLGADLWNQSPDTAARLVEAVIDECSDAGAALAKVRVDLYVAVAMGGPPAGRRWPYGGAGVENWAAAGLADTWSRPSPDWRPEEMGRRMFGRGFKLEAVASARTSVRLHMNSLYLRAAFRPEAILSQSRGPA